MREADGDGGSARALSIFLVAGEHSGDALGAKLMRALVALHPGPVAFAGVGGEHMQAEGLTSLFPMSDVAVMGPVAILKRLPRIVRRVHQTVDAALAARPDALVIIDSPEFTHPIARRVRRQVPDIPIIDYVSPTVWAWRPGRARRMRPYVDHVLALLPFEPEAHARLGGPACTYVGHPLVERLGWIAALDPAPLVGRLGIGAGRIPIVMLPGSRPSEVGKLLAAFRAAIDIVAARRPCEVLVPAVSSVRRAVEQGLAGWQVRAHMIEGEEDKWRAFKLARGALAASGTVTLELALAGAPMVVGYRVDRIAAPFLRRMIKAPSTVLPNLVLGRNAFPELHQEDCTPERLAAALEAALVDGPARSVQLAALAEVPGRLELAGGTPSEQAARIVLEVAGRGR